jgi:O-antigen ligase
MTQASSVITSASGKRSWVGLILGLWLTGVFAASLYGKLEGEGYRAFGMTLLAASLLWPPVYFVLSRCRFVPTGFNTSTFAALGLFGLFCGLSSFGSHAPLESTGYTVLTILTSLVVLQFNANLDASGYETGLKTYAVLMAALVLGFAAYDYVPGGRLGSGKGILNPASFALVTMSVFVAAMAVRRSLVRIPILIAMGTVIFMTGARASAVAALFGLAVTLVLRRRTAGMRGWFLLLLCCAIGSAVAAYYADAVIRGSTEFFAIQDRNRGLASGASGRLETWGAAWGLFLSHPIFGVGFRAHEALLKINTSAHNGYLALLAEIGLIGFASALFLALTGVWNIWRRNQDPSQTYSYSVLLGLACGYLVLALFERYFINVGNPTSLLFLLAILSPSLSTGRPVPALPTEDSVLPPQMMPSGQLRWPLVPSRQPLSGQRAGI